MTKNEGLIEAIRCTEMSIAVLRSQLKPDVRTLEAIKRKKEAIAILVGLKDSE